MTWHVQNELIMCQEIQRIAHGIDINVLSQEPKSVATKVINAVNMRLITKSARHTEKNTNNN